MRKFLIESPRFAGNAEIVYDTDGKLCLIDVMNCEIDPDVLHHFKQAVPIDIERVLNGTAFGAATTVVESSYEVTFDMFWKAYGKKINKIRAEKEWNALTKVDQVKAYFSIKGYDWFLNNVEKGRAKADPETYLRKRYFDNEWKKSTKRN